MQAPVGKTGMIIEDYLKESQSYQNPARLRSMLDRYADGLMNIEKKYFKHGQLIRGDTVLLQTQYEKKALEIVLPDVIISENSLEILNKFKKDMAEKGLEVWYVITK